MAEIQNNKQVEKKLNADEEIYPMTGWDVKRGGSTFFQA